MATTGTINITMPNGEEKALSATMTDGADLPGGGGGDIPEYEGPYSITENGTYNTTDKKLTDDISVNVAATGDSLVTMFNEYVETASTSLNWKNMFGADSGASNILSRYLTSDILDKLDFSGHQPTSTELMFESCSKLVRVPLFDTSNVTNMCRMFRHCSKLIEIPAYNASNVTDLKDIFYSCSKLEAIHMFGMKVNFSLSAMFNNNFSREAIVEVLNNLATVSSTQTLTLGSKLLAKLTDADKAIATNKGWTLA